VTLAIDRTQGRVLWERPAPKATAKSVDKRNNPASPSQAVADGRIYVRTTQALSAFASR